MAVLTTSPKTDVPPMRGVGAWAGGDHFVNKHSTRVINKGDSVIQPLATCHGEVPYLSNWFNSCNGCRHRDLGRRFAMARIYFLWFILRKQYFAFQTSSITKIVAFIA
ncbi:hypothetical protein AVEN_40418-1 [Araneus ventricosus]|uniref:Uncharacterized protein n=1 Tax=Araneus ventricosus TaxID=182803 RepID=A0A4Y2D9K3_ARAVE|nr:hypothetical protein AVEN_40418-1 [Araneus ventricosus]